MGKNKKNRKDAVETVSKPEEVEDVKPSKDNESENNNKTNKQKKRKNKATLETVTSNKDVRASKPKKIKFTEDGDAIQDEESTNTSANKSENDKLMLDMKESDVKDEDIDQFCDEIDEEDNKQYESWIELLEEKLGGSNNKVKNKKETK